MTGSTALEDAQSKGEKEEEEGGGGGGGGKEGGEEEEEEASQWGHMLLTILDLLKRELDLAESDIEFQQMADELNMAPWRARNGVRKFGSIAKFLDFARYTISASRAALAALDREECTRLCWLLKSMGYHSIISTMKLLLSMSEESFENLKLKTAVEMQDADMVAKVTFKLKSKAYSKEKQKDPLVIEQSPLLIQPGLPLCRSTVPISSPLTHAALNCAESALKINRLLLGFLRDRPYTYPLACLHEILALCIALPNLRDEAFFQIIKQLSGNGDSEIHEKLGWEAMSACLWCFPPSSELENHLEWWLRCRNKESVCFCFIDPHMQEQERGPRLEALHEFLNLIFKMIIRVKSNVSIERKLRPVSSTNRGTTNRK